MISKIFLFTVWLSLCVGQLQFYNGVDLYNVPNFRAISTNYTIPFPPGNSMSLALYVRGSLVLTGTDNCGISFIGSQDLLFIIYVESGFTLTLDCEGTTFGLAFQNFYSVSISGEDSSSRFILQNCVAPPGRDGGALYVSGPSMVASQTSFIGNSGNGSAFAGYKTYAIFNGDVAFINNTGTAVIINNPGPDSAGAFFGTQGHPVYLQNLGEDVACYGFDSKYYTIINFLNANKDDIDGCCRDCSVYVNSQTRTCDCGDSQANEDGGSGGRNGGAGVAIGVGVAVPLIVLVAVAAIIGFVFLRRRQFKKNAILSVGTEMRDTTYLAILDKNDKEKPNPSGPIILNKEWEIDYDTLQLNEVLGEGAFGRVWRAIWRQQDVAVKQLLDSNVAPDKLNEFLAEATLMMKLRPHKNCLQIYGVCSNPQKPLCIVMEFLPVGSLRSLLESSKLISDHKMYVMALDIASGCLHLHCENIIHRDLACRNLLLDEYWRVKVADYGMAKLFGGSDYEGKAKVSLRWSSPEVLQKGEFSFASDVWSFGVILYEMWSRRVPYHENSDAIDVGRKIVYSNLRLTPPEEMPKEIRALMAKCFADAPSARPKFDEIIVTLKNIVANSHDDEERGSVPQIDYGITLQLEQGYDSTFDSKEGQRKNTNEGYTQIGNNSKN